MLSLTKSKNYIYKIYFMMILWVAMDLIKSAVFTDL